MSELPHGAKRYLVHRDDSCTGWRGAKFYGRPVWTLWMQRMVWEQTFGPIPDKARVSETCALHGCLTPEHLRLSQRQPRQPKTHCRNCGGVLSRDKNNKTYCQMCLKVKAQTRRAHKKEDNDTIEV
jgi:hypothetical protein